MGDVGAIALFLADHDGIITAAQARRLGSTRGEIRGRLERGEWLAVTRGVYRCASHPFTETAMVRVASLASGGVLDRVTAAWWHGMLGDLPTVVSLACPRVPKLDLPVAVDVVRRRYPAESITAVRDLTVTDPCTTALLAAVELRDGSQFLDRALQQECVDVPGMERSAETNAGLRGMAQARRLLAVASSDSESAAERLFVEIATAWGLPPWVQQFPIGGWSLDFAWPELKVGVEISGWAFHRDVRRHGSDLAKANYLERHHWAELQYDWHMLHDSPGDCIQEVIDLINSRILYGVQA